MSAQAVRNGLWSAKLSPLAGCLTPSSPGRRSGAGRPQCRLRANCDGCAYLRPAFPQCVTCLRARSTGAAHSFRPRAYCDGCAYLRSVSYSLLAGPQGRATTVSAKGVLRTRRARLAVGGLVARVSCWTGQGRRHADLPRGRDTCAWSRVLVIGLTLARFLLARVAVPNRLDS